MPAIGTGRESTNAQPAKKPKLKKAVKKTVNVRPPDRADDRVTVRAQQLARSVPKTPDQADRKRAPAQKAQDAKVVAANVRDSRRKVVVTNRQTGVRAALTGKGGKVIDASAQFKRNQAASRAQTATRVAPVLKVLDQTTRPLHAVAGATDAAVQGKNVPRAALRGIQNKDKTTFSDVLEHVGVKNKYVRAVVGTTLDVGLDPTTYVTGGTASVARKAATTAAGKAEKKALEKGLTQEQARKFGERAATQAEKAGDQTKGVTVKFAGKELPGVRKVTAKASKPVRAAGRKVTPQKLRDNSRAVLADVNPDVAPTGVSKATSRAAVQATRTARAKSNRGLHEAQQQAVGIKAQVGEANYSRIIDAIEAGNIKSLPDDLAKVAIRVRSQFRHANRLRKQAGIRGGEIKARPKVPVPEVVADSGASAKALSKATRAEARAQRELEAARSTADVHQGRAEVLSRNVSGSKAEKAAERGRSKRKHRPSAPLVVPSREEFIAKAPKASRDSPEPTVENLTRNVKSGPSGFRVEPIHVSMLDPGTKAHVGWGEEMAGAKVVVWRDLKGKPRGALHILLDEHGKPDVLQIAVDPAFRGEGLASSLYKFAQRKGLNVEKASGRGGYTTAGAALAHKRLTARAKARAAASASRVAAPKYAGGGHGVQQTATAAKDAAQRLKNAVAAREAAEGAHAKTVADAAVQRAARALAEKTNAKRVAAPKGYIPHNLTDEAIAESGKQAGGVGRKVVRPSSSRARSDNRPLAALRKESPGKYSEDLPTLYANRKAEGATAVARAELNRRIADLGRNVKKGQDLTLEKGESVYHVVGSDLRKVSDKKELGALVDKGGKKGRYVVLNDDIVKRAIEGSQPTLQGPGIVRGLDKAQAGFKRIALATPGFHLRNLVGDTQNAYLGQGGHRLPGNMRRAAKVLRAEGRQDKALRTLDKVPDKTATLKTPKYGNVTYEEVARQLTKHGGMRSGFTAREIPELAGEKATVGRVRLPRKLKQGLLNREDLPRLTTAVDALRKGASWEEAAQRVAEFHFDYGHLTHFERQIARRAAPFYCVPIDHEILTRHGFKRNHEVAVGDDVLSLNHETGELEWTPLLEVAEFEFDGILKTIKRRGADFSFTEDHRWPVVTGKSFVKGKWYGGKRLIKPARELNRSDRIPLTGEFRGVESSLTPRQAAILGWLVGDGYFRWRGNYCEMLVYQSPKKHLEEITTLLGHPGRGPHPQTGVVPVPIQRDDRTSLIAAGFRTKDDLLGLVGGLSREAADAMWDAMFKAEGWTEPKTGQQSFAQVAGPVLEAFQMLCLMTGRTCNLGPERKTRTEWQRQATHQAYVRKQTHIQVGNLGEERYTGTIWCPRTAHGTWVIRHNGTVIMTGNTFSARNIPLQVKSVVTKPGKYANYQKVREEAGKLTGMDEESKKARDLTEKLKAAGVKLPDRWEASLSEWEQRNAGVPISWKGHKFTVSMGLPLADLNEFPGAALSSQLSEYYNKGVSLGSPLWKDPFEYMENHSFFFRDDIEREYSPLVAAPEWVKALPPRLKKMMGVTENYIDKKTGKKTLGYRAKADYVVKAIPGTPAFVNKLATDGHDRVGKGPAGKALAFVGVKATPYDPITNAVNLAYERNQEISKRMAALRQQTHPKNDQPISAKNPTPEYSRLNAQLKLTQEIAYQGRVRSGYKKLPTQGGPPKLKASSAGRVKVPGVSGRVKVPGVGGRVKVPAG